MDLLSLAAESLFSVEEKQIQVVWGFTAATEMHVTSSRGQIKINQNDFINRERPPSFTRSEPLSLASRSTRPARATFP